MDDFKLMLDEMHKRGIRLIMDLVANHTSDEHEWFKKATEYLAGLPEGKEPDAEECPYIDYYHFRKDSGHLATIHNNVIRPLNISIFPSRQLANRFCQGSCHDNCCSS